MQEILYRGKRVDNNEWLHGFYDGCYEGATINYLKDGIAWNCRVHPETIGRYIGIKDIHQKKVFQGDIVKVKETVYTNCGREEVEEVREFTGEVVWHQYGWHIAEKVEIGTRYHSLWLWNVEGEEDDTMEIIGNRWDNPELVAI